MKKLSLTMKSLAVAALVAVSSMAFATPASAAYYYQVRCSYTSYGIRCSYVPTSYKPTYTTPPRTTTASTAKTAPTATAPKSPATTTPTTTTTAGLTAAEQQMLNLVNQERAKNGLAPLKADLQLTQLARLKSQDMIKHNYFSHQSPTYGSPFDMMKRYGVSYRTAGENLAGNSSVTGAHTGLMNSPGHRANILSTKYTHVGIGIAQGGSYGMMFTQMFVGR
ncbi:MAG: CAP domain-containing protein [Bacillota bacterium]